MLSLKVNGPWVTAYSPVQTIAVDVAVGTRDAVGVIDGVNVSVGGNVFVGVRGNAVRIASKVAL